MTQNVKIYTMAISLSLMMTMLLLMFSSSIVSVGSSVNRRQPTVNLVQLKNNYKSNTRILVNQAFQLSQNNRLTTTRVEKIRYQLLALKVPAPYKQLHLDLILAMDRYNEYSKTGDEQKKFASDEIINKSKLSYSWLN